MLPFSVSRSGENRDPVALATLQVDVIADFICPWCFLGKRRLDRALTAVFGPRRVRWFPFELNPEMPVEGLPLERYLSSRFGSMETVMPGLQLLRQLGREEGVAFDFDAIERVPNTFKAHQLLYHAASAGRDAGTIADDLMSAFFERGENIGDPEVLEAAGVRHGIETAELRRVLSDSGSEQVVRGQQAQIRRGGITGVPAFLVNQQMLVSGAQSAEALVGVFDKAVFGDEQPAEAGNQPH